MAARLSAPGGVLTPYVPRLVLEWDRDHRDELHRRIPGTLVFADLSGFTAMSERLATLGRLGAEELTQHLDATFTELLDVAALRGGSLLKFGGDALLLFFWGDDHHMRGTVAATEMRARLRAVGRRQTSAGRVTLRMSVGAHTGSVDFFLVGGSVSGGPLGGGHRDLIVAGPAADTVVAMEGIADPGEIVLSPALASAVPERSRGDQKGAGVLLKRAPSLPVGVEVELAPRDVDAGQFLSLPVRNHLTEVEAEGEHRWLTVAFLHLIGVNRVLSEQGPTAAASALQKSLRCIQETFAEHGVSQLECDVYHDGPKILAVAGAPATHENDPERMLIALHEIASADHDLALKIGTNFGLAFAGPIGPWWRRTYTVMGDAVNTAARVMAHAQAGQVLSTPAVLDRSLALFETSMEDPFKAKGKSTLVATLSVRQPTGSRGPAREETLPLVGRAAELSVLAELVRSAEHGTPGEIEVVGDTGIGKTRLVDELVARTTIAVVRSGCAEYAMATPYAGARPLVASGLDVEGQRAEQVKKRLLHLDPTAEPFLPLVGTVLGIDLGTTPEVESLDHRFGARRMASVVGRLLAAARPDPTLWLIDDTHWMDEASSELLAQVLTAQPTWAVCTTTRVASVRGGIASRTQLHLDPLPPDQAAQLAKAAIGERLLPDEIEAVAHRSGGSPLFIRELATAAGRHDQLPDRVETLLATRIDALAPRARELLRTASVLGPRSPIGVLDLVMPDWRLRIAEEFLVIDGSDLVFRHRLHQEVAYASISFRTRRELHRRAGEVIEQSDHPTAETLSLHFSAAHEWERSWRYSLEAAQHAKRTFANVDAAVFFRRAVDAARHVPVDRDQLGDAWADMANAYFYALRLEEADLVARQARVAQKDDPVQLARQFMVSTEVARRQRRLAAAKRFAQSGLRVVSGHEAGRANRVRLLTALAQINMDQGKAEVAVETAHQAIAEGVACGDARALALAQITVFSVLVQAGRVGEAMEHSTAPIAALEAEGALWQLAGHHNAVGVAHDALGNWRDAVSSYDEAARTAELAGDTHQTMISTYNVGELRWRQGRIDDARRAMSTVLEVWEPAGFAVGVASAKKVVGELAAFANDWEGASADLESARSTFGSLGAASMVDELTVALALAAALGRRPTVALDLLSPRPERDQPPHIQARAYRAAGLAHAQLGDVSRAAASLHEAADVSPGFEQAVTFDAWVQLQDILGAPPQGWRRIVTDVFTHLGVEATPRAPR